LTKGFYLGATEVTVGQLRAFVRKTGYKSDAETGGGTFVDDHSGGGLKDWVYWDNPGFRQTKSHPVTCISWNDAKAFIQWLNQEEAASYRLPTEAEWEYACRAGSRTRFYFGDNEGLIGEYAWYGSNSLGGTHPVGWKRPNAWGLFDMHGNVWEWCEDGDKETPSFRVLRGGGWNQYAGQCRSAKRIRFPPELPDWEFGFRLAMTEQ
jgi:formylglycine-generating enzyme required for sulfatase activity